MMGILNKIKNIQRKHKESAHQRVFTNYKEMKQSAIDSTKRLIQSYIDELKVYHNYRDLTKHEQYLLSGYVDDWYESERIILIQDRDDIDWRCSYIIDIKLWQPSVLTYYVDKVLLKEDSYEVHDADMKLCVLLAAELQIINKIVSAYQILKNSIDYYDEKIKEEGENK